MTLPCRQPFFSGTVEIYTEEWLSSYIRWITLVVVLQKLLGVNSGCQDTKKLLWDSSGSSLEMWKYWKVLRVVIRVFWKESRHGLLTACEGAWERKGKDDTVAFGLNNWKDGIVSVEMEKATGGWGLEEEWDHSCGSAKFERLGIRVKP